MKRQGHLIEQIAEMENLILAYYKAQKGKSDRPEVREYGRSLQRNLNRLQRQILSGEVETGNYHYFTIYDPKKRTICAAPFSQRVLHHALMNVCHPYFEKVQIFDSYATRPGKGTYAALERAKRFQRRMVWYLKLDFCKFFDSLDHGIIKHQLKRLFKDAHLLHIFDQIITSYQTEAGKGVPIGNLTSQYFANHYLAGLDHFVKEELKIRAYVRYMDDGVLWHSKKETLMEARAGFRHYADSRLNLKLKPDLLNRTTHGLPFLGYLLYPDKTHLARRSRRRFRNKLRHYNEKMDTKQWSQAEYQRHIMPLIAFTEHANARGFRKNLIMTD